MYLRKIIGTFCRCLILATILSRAVFAQVAKQTGFSFTGIPSANYNSDEETGYGVNGALYNHSTGEYEPYFWAVESEIYQTTRGPSSYFIFFDSPYIIVNHRLTVDLRYKNNVSNPYYGIGNTTKYNKTLEKANPGYYRFGRKTVKSTSDLQCYLQQNQLRALLGIGLFYTANNTLEGALFFCNRKIFLVQKEGGPITSSLDLSMIQETMNRLQAAALGSKS